MHTVDTTSKLESPQGKHLFDRFADAVALESLRQVLLRELVHGGQRGAAESVGVGRTVVRKILEMKTFPQRHNWRQLKEWAADRPEVVPALETICLAVLVRIVPAEKRLTARRELAELLARFYPSSGHPKPEWLKAELTGTATPVRH